MKTIEDQLKQAKLEEQLRRNRILEADEELRARDLASYSAFQDYLQRHDEDETEFVRSCRDCIISVEFVRHHKDCETRTVYHLRPMKAATGNA